MSKIFYLIPALLVGLSTINSAEAAVTNDCPKSPLDLVESKKTMDSELLTKILETGVLGERLVDVENEPTAKGWAKKASGNIGWEPFGKNGRCGFAFDVGKAGAKKVIKVFIQPHCPKSISYPVGPEKPEGQTHPGALRGILKLRSLFRNPITIENEQTALDWAKESPDNINWKSFERKGQCGFEFDVTKPVEKRVIRIFFEPGSFAVNDCPKSILHLVGDQKTEGSTPSTALKVILRERLFLDSPIIIENKQTALDWAKEAPNNTNWKSFKEKGQCGFAFDVTKPLEKRVIRIFTKPRALLN